MKLNFKKNRETDVFIFFSIPARRIIEFLGLKGEKFPTMRIIQMKEDIDKYKVKFDEKNLIWGCPFFMPVNTLHKYEVYT